MSERVSDDVDAAEDVGDEEIAMGADITTNERK